MPEDNTISRRKTMKLAGAAAATAVVAGCSDDDDGNGNGDDNGNGDAEAIEIEAGETIEFEGLTAGWVGVAPSSIEGEENPTLALEAGEDYEMGWNEGDGSGHNIEIRDDGGDVVDDLSTDVESEGGDDQFLDFTAEEEMAEYVCEPHAGTMVGELQVE